jgi:RNA polymerase sigma factor (sigma-70 family)
VAVRSDADVQSEFLVEHRPFVVKLCRILLRDAEESEDAAQQVFLNAYRAIGVGVTPLNVRAWLAQIARNECRSRVRRNAAHPETPLTEAFPDGGPDPADAAAQLALVARLRQELAALPERQREAILLREFRGLSYDELAAAMDETGPAVESLLQRARRRLVARLEETRRPFVGVALMLDWIRNARSRLLPGSGATEAVATGGTAAVVAKLAAAGVVAVSVGVAGGDVAPAPQAPPRPAVGQDRASSEASAGSRPLRAPSGAVTTESRPRGESHVDSDRPRSHGDAARPEETSSSSEHGDTPAVIPGEPGSSGPGPSGSGTSGSGSSTSGSGESGSGSSSSGPGGGSEGTSSSGSSEQSGPESSGSSGSGSSGPGSSDSGSDGSSGHSGSGSSGSGSDD